MGKGPISEKLLSPCEILRRMQGAAKKETEIKSKETPEKENEIRPGGEWGGQGESAFRRNGPRNRERHRKGEQITGTEGPSDNTREAQTF